MSPSPDFKSEGQDNCRQCDDEEYQSHMSCPSEGLACSRHAFLRLWNRSTTQAGMITAWKCPTASQYGIGSVRIPSFSASWALEWYIIALKLQDAHVLQHENTTDIKAHLLAKLLYLHVKRISQSGFNYEGRVEFDCLFAKLAEYRLASVLLPCSRNRALLNIRLHTSWLWFWATKTVWSLYNHENLMQWRWCKEHFPRLSDWRLAEIQLKLWEVSRGTTKPYHFHTVSKRQYD